METMGERWHRESERHLVRDGVAVGMALLISWGAFTAIGGAVCFSKDRTPHVERAEAMEVSDVRYEPPMEYEVETAPCPEVEEVETDSQEGQYLEPEEHAYWYDQPTGYDETCLPSEGLTRDGGVNWYDGRMETYYSSDVLYHHRTGEWTVDDEGFYHDSEGRYVVAASDKEQGEVFEGSMGECIVLDTGCDAGVTDYYVAW